MKKPIQDLNIGYELLHPTSIIATHCHYQRTVIRGRENLPKDGAYIIAPCHQNALMEPMAMLAVLPSRIVFLARADIFQKPAARAFLTFLKILPVYRIRDGKSSLAKNEEIFAKSKQVLLSRVPLCMMAEGRHNDRHQLLPLVKGMFRIAGETQRELGDTPLYIVPTGIDFDHYEHPYSNLVINIGKPIPVLPFMEQFEADEPVALNQMRERLAVALKQQMHHVESKENYEEVYALCHILNRSWRKRKHRCNTAWNRFITRCEIAQHFNKSTNQPSTPSTLPNLSRHLPTASPRPARRHRPVASAVDADRHGCRGSRCDGDSALPARARGAAVDTVVQPTHTDSHTSAGQKAHQGPAVPQLGQLRHPTGAVAALHHRHHRGDVLHPRHRLGCAGSGNSCGGGTRQRHHPSLPASLAAEPATRLATPHPPQRHAAVETAGESVD